MILAEGSQDTIVKLGLSLAKYMYALPALPIACMCVLRAGKQARPAPLDLSEALMARAAAAAAGAADSPCSSALASAAAAACAAVKGRHSLEGRRLELSTAAAEDSSQPGEGAVPASLQTSQGIGS
jgi:hypothetical protein